MAEIIKVKDKLKVDLIICLPGNSWDINFQINLIKLQSYLEEKKISFMLNIVGGSNISFVREHCLGVTDREAYMLTPVKPFHEEIDYKFIIWIDSDVIFEPLWIVQMMSYNKNIVSGFYKKSSQHFTSTLWQKDIHKPYAVMTEKDLENKKDLIRLKWNGFGFMLIKRGVFETIPRPWFLTTVVDYGQGLRMAAEDVYFCLQAEKYGFEILGDPLVRCGHLKTALLR
jgi:hypothetical protein